jgi:hypothetical protein
MKSHIFGVVLLNGQCKAAKSLTEYPKLCKTGKEAAKLKGIGASTAKKVHTNFMLAIVMSTLLLLLLAD